jgi:outer membrane protein assembly factor BamB
MRRLGLPSLLALPLAALWLVPAAEAPALGAQPLRQPIRRPPRPVAGPVTPAAAHLSDADALKQAGLTDDDPAALIEYLKARTLTDVDQNSIGEIIKKFGSDDFEQRLKATEEVEKFGPAAIGPLKAAERDRDPEVAYRAHQALKRMEKVPHSQVAAAAVRALVKLKPKEAAAVLLGFLPMADSDEVAEEIRSALVELAAADGKPEPALVAALSDKSVVRRSAAYVALTGGPDGKGASKAALPLVKGAVRKETDTDAKFLGLWALLMTTREKEFVPDLIAMIPKLPRGRIWQLEEFLLQLAGKDRPDAKFGKGEAALAKAKDAWEGWWKKKGDSLDLAKFDFKPRITGYTDIIEYDYRGYGQYRVVTLGPDLKEKVRLGGAGAAMLNYPSDVKKLPNGNYLVAEQNGNRLTERDSTGRIVKTTNVTQPLSINPIPGGGMVVVCRNQVVQYDKDMKQQWHYQRTQYDIMGGRRLPGGDVVFVTNTFQGGNCFRLAAKEVEKNGNKTWEVKADGNPLTLGRMQQFQSIDVTGDDKVLVCEFNRVVEYDLKAEKGKAKELWSYAANNPTSAQRLPNGNTLIAVVNQPPNGKVYEIDTAGDVVWEYESKDGLRPARAYRR